jgi:hypothetical protein
VAHLSAPSSGAGTPACAPLLRRNPSRSWLPLRVASDLSSTVPRRQAHRENDACAPLLNRNPSDLGSQPHAAPDDRKTNGPKFCRSRFQPRRNAGHKKGASAPEVPRKTSQNCFLLQPGCCSCDAIFCHLHSSFSSHHPSLITRHIHSPSHAHPVNFYCGNYGFSTTTNAIQLRRSGTI